jgi:hydroxymethylpyrimidine/phosphomethylpyrimidine kinase
VTTGRRSSPRVLVFAGFEPSGRAGLLADLAAIRQAGGEGLGVATALTAQGTRSFLVRPVAPAVLRRQIRALLELGAPRGVKLGMVPGRAQLSVIRQELKRYRVPWVVDPVTRTSLGQPLSALTAADYLRLAGARVVLTPNLPELTWLGEDAEALVARGFGAVVVKGGHAGGRSAIDVLVTREGRVRFAAPRLERAASRRGTGCRFAATLATHLARGEAVADAARLAKRAVARYLRGP